MFGYIAPYIPELKCKELKMYKSYYCSICFAIKRLGGRLYCTGLSNDITSFSILKASLNSEKETIKKVRCIWNPFKKVNILTNYQDEIEQAAVMNMILFYYKVKDNLHDERNILAFILELLLFPRFIKIRKRNDVLNNMVIKGLDVYNNNEKDSELSHEAIIDPYAVLIGNMISFTISDSFTKKCFYWIGYHTAKSICIIDAIDDYEKDEKKKVPNILNSHDIVNKLESDFSRIDLCERKLKIYNIAETSLFYSLHQIRTTIEMLPFFRNSDIISNIFIEGIDNSIIKAKKEEREETMYESV